MSIDSKIGWNFLFSSNWNYRGCEEGREYYKYSDNSAYYKDNKGTDAYRYTDGSGYFHGGDGSDGYRYIDGSGYFKGADGSEGYIYSDGSGYYSDANGDYYAFSAEDDYTIGDDIALDTEGAGATNLLDNSIKSYQAHQEYVCKQKKKLERQIKEVQRKLLDIEGICPPMGVMGCHAQNYKKIAKCFADAGFENIHLEPIFDLINGWLIEDGTIHEITIDSKEYFSKRSRFFKNAKVVIKYHTYRKNRK